MKLSKIIRKARELIETKGFTKGWFACDKDGMCVDPRSRKAVRFCSSGAIKRVTRNTLKFDEYEAMRYLLAAVPAAQKKSPWIYIGVAEKELPWIRVEAYNDSKNTRKRHIINLFKRAERLAIEDGK